ncbi:hypothetical protein ACYUJ6_12325 [Clostridium sp. JNZ X4-2]
MMVYKLFPKNVPVVKDSHENIMISLKNLIKKESVLRQSSLSGAMIFGAFSVFWATLIFFLESPVYNMGSKAAGLFALLGIGGIVAVPNILAK